MLRVTGSIGTSKNVFVLPGGAWRGIYAALKFSLIVETTRGVLGALLKSFQMTLVGVVVPGVACMQGSVGHDTCQTQNTCPLTRT